MIRFIHTSDWQLGMRRYYLSDETQARFAQERIDAIRRLGELARAHDAAFMVVAGDVYESNQVSEQTIRRSLAALGDVGVPVFLLPGNHDPLDPGSVFRGRVFTEGCPAHVHVLEDSTPLPVPGVAGVEVMGAPWFSKRPLSDLLQDALGLNDAPGETVRIAVAHGAVDVLSPDEHNPALIGLRAAEAAFAGGRVHYVALGDKHSTLSVGDSGRLWYSGAPVATDFREPKPNQALLVGIDGTSPPRVTELPTSDWRFMAETVVLNSADDVDAFEHRLDALDKPERTILRLSLEGTLNVAQKARVDALLARARDLFACVDVPGDKQDLAVMPDATDAETAGLSGYARDTWNALAARAAEGGEDARVASDAVALLYRLSEREG